MVSDVKRERVLVLTGNQSRDCLLSTFMPVARVLWVKIRKGASSRVLSLYKFEEISDLDRSFA